MTDAQLELGLGNGRGCQWAGRRQRRLGRANWWFERMRQVVDRALDWAPAPPARPEQIWFDDSRRPGATNAPAGAAGANQSTASEERQICE